MSMNELANGIWLCNCRKRSKQLPWDQTKLGLRQLLRFAPEKLAMLWIPHFVLRGYHDECLHEQCCSNAEMAACHADAGGLRKGL